MNIKNINNIEFDGKNFYSQRLKYLKQRNFSKALSDIQEAESYRARILASKQQHKSNHLFSAFFEGILRLFT